MIATMITVKVTQCNSGLFEHAVSISKQPTGSIHIGNIIQYLIYLLTPFPSGLKVDVEGSSTVRSHCK